MALNNSPMKGAFSSEDEDCEMDPLREIQLLRNQLMERDAHISMIEDDFTKCTAQVSDLERQIMVWREKYDRLYDSHKRVQKINQNLEDKLLQMADKCSIDKSQLARDIEILSLRLAESNHSISGLQKENERYKNDMNLAIQLLQCKPDHFVSQKFDSLPSETQARVSSYIMSKAKNDLTPSPTGKSASTPEKLNHQEFEFNISASLMSKILEESVQNTISKHCDTCTCLKKSLNPFMHKENKVSVETQTGFSKPELYCPNCSPKPPLPTPLSPLTPVSPPTPVAPTSQPGETPQIMEVKSVGDKKVPPNSPVPNKTQQCLSENAHSNIPLIHSPAKRDPSPLANINYVPMPKPSEENVKLVSLKHREIMDKIGENLYEMNVKHDFRLPSIEPMSGHHRLCDRTKHTPFQNAEPECTHPKAEETKPVVDMESCKPILHSPKLVSTIQMADDLDVSFSQIENPVPIPNNLESRPNMPQQKSKPDLSHTETPKTVHNSSISSNEAESKTSSSRSWKNNGSYTGSNAKVHVGPGPRFCSLRMQAGSKSILLDNAQPNIAPVLYTRTRNFESSPLVEGELTLLDRKPDQKPPYLGHVAQVNTNNTITRNVYSNTPHSEEIPILDLPNEELPLSKPIQVCEKPESGYKSNDSAEIIDKLLFGMDTPIEEGIKETCTNPDGNGVAKSGPGEAKEKGSLEATKEKPTFSYKPSMDVTTRAEAVKHDRREALQNMKVFNFDQYERNNLRIHHTNKMFPGHKSMVAHLSYNSGKLPGGAQLILPDKKETDALAENASPSGDTGTKSLAEGNKKYVRNIANQTQTEQSNSNRESIGGEKSSSSLSSDDSAAVLQKQQLIRVAEWVQKNLEMEQMDIENSDSCQQSAEELHHVRNDFPRPAKVDHRTRKASLKGHRSSHHSAKHVSAPKTEEPICERQLAGDEEREAKVSMVMSNWESETVGGSHSTVTSYTTRSYSREELARMEYNVKQFLLNGTRWTSLDSAQERRTSSKTETDL